MISLDFDNSQIFAKYSTQSNTALQCLLQKRKNSDIGFMDLDTMVDVEKIQKFAISKKEQYAHLVILGIGWSALWLRAVVDALKWKYYNDLFSPKLFIVDNVDPYEISDVLEAIDLEKTLFFVISKSGGTIETLSGYEFFKSQILGTGLQLKDHFVAITGENSRLHQEAKQHDIPLFFLEENIGGRFSVLSNVWLVPLAFCGIDIRGLLDGVSATKDVFLSQEISQNIALQSAIIQYDAYQKNKNITVFFPYLANFKNFGAWYKQLFWESLWKNNIPANLFTSVGTTDQHSDLQLFSEWKNDKLFLFLELEEFEKNIKVFDDEEITFTDILKNAKYGTQQALDQKERMNYTLKLAKLDEKHLGALILFFEFQVAYLWEFLMIDAYNQPWVEESKRISKEKMKTQFISSKLF